MKQSGFGLIPTVIEETHRGTRSMDVFTRLLVDRIVFLGSEVNAMVANTIVAQLLFLDSEDPEKPVHLYINSPGGSVTAGMAIYDTMQFVKAPVSTICVGMAASMGAFLLAAGEPGMRFALPHSEIMIHQPWAGGIGGQVSDIEIRAKRLKDMKQQLNRLLAEHTGQSIETITTDTDRDRFLTAAEAADYGIIDRIVSKHEED